MMGDLKKLLQQTSCTLVVENGETRTFSNRGIAALYLQLNKAPGFLKGALVADKVVGKGAAALMIAGGIKALYAEVISEAAMALLTDAPAGIKVEYGTIVPRIDNRAHTGMCPVEQLCLSARTAEECLPLIASFMSSTR